MVKQAAVIGQIEGEARQFLADAMREPHETYAPIFSTFVAEGVPTAGGKVTIDTAVTAIAFAIMAARASTSLPCKSGEGARVVPVEQLREWYTAAWATWLETIGDADDDEDRPTPAHLNEMEALLSAPVPDATQTREAELVAALEPFSDACNFTTADDSESLYDTLAAEKLTWRDLRRARAVLSAGAANGEAR